MRHDRSLESVAMTTVRRLRMLEGGERVVVSVSGGPDSVSLLLFLHSIAREMQLELNVFHLDHMLRGRDSQEDSLFVQELAEGLGVPCTAIAVDVRRETAGLGRSPQEAAREVRLGRLRLFAEEVSADRVALGHTADDQVETFLMRVLQGAGLKGLAAIPAVAGPFIRPLIEVWREEVDDYCARMGVEPRLDASNLDPSYMRNHVRLSLVPFLTSEFGGAVRDVILREVESLSVDREFMMEHAARAFEAAATASDGELRVSVPRLLELPEALRRGVIMDAWSRIAPGEPSLGWQHLMDILDKVVEGRSGATLDLPGELVVRREYDDVVFGPPEADRPCPPAVLMVPGSVSVPWAGVSIEARRVKREEVEFGEDRTVEFARPDLSTPMEVRAPAPGDRFQPLGSGGTRKLKDYFIDIKLPRHRRRQCPVVTSGGTVVWLAGHRLDERFRVRPGDDGAVMLIMRRSGEYDSQGEER